MKILLSCLLIVAFCEWTSIEMESYYSESVDISFFEKDSGAIWSDSNSIGVSLTYPSGIIVDTTIWKDNENNGFESDDFSTWEDE